MDRTIKDKAAVVDLLKILNSKIEERDDRVELLITYINDKSAKQSEKLRKVVVDLYKKTDIDTTLPLRWLAKMIDKLTCDKNLNRPNELGGLSNGSILYIAIIMLALENGRLERMDYTDPMCEIADIYTYIVFIVTEFNYACDSFGFDADLQNSWIIDLCIAVSNRKEKKQFRKACCNGDTKQVLHYIRSEKVKASINSEVNILMQKARLSIERLESAQVNFALTLESVLTSWLNTNQRLEIVLLESVSEKLDLL